jgi:hypothetical protein
MEPCINVPLSSAKLSLCSWLLVAVAIVVHEITSLPYTFVIRCI